MSLQTWWNQMATRIIAARRAFADPSLLSMSETKPASAREAVYRERWDYATNAAFDDLGAWSSRIDSYGLYAKTRAWYNPAARLAEFYSSQVYPGYVPQGDGAAPPGVREAFPLAPGTDPALVAALRQVGQWSNLQTLKDVITWRGAALGDAGLLEIVDDEEAGKVRWRLWWPGYVTDLDLSPYGDVRGYTLEYDAWDRERDETYRYTETVTPDEIRTKRGDEAEEVRPNPYGFAPACWVRHIDDGTPYGQPAFRGYGKLDLLNSYTSRLADYVKTRIKAPYGLAADFPPTGVGNFDQASMGTSDAADEYSSQVVGGGDGDDVFLMYLPPDTKGVPLFGNIAPQECYDLIDKALAEIENDNPELNAWNQLREMSSVSGVAIERALGDTQGRLYRAQSTYDQQLVKAFQMSIAIAGWRINGGDWGTGPLTMAQEAFRPFSLDSYARGDLDFMLLPRPLVTETVVEEMEAVKARFDAVTAGRAVVGHKRALVEAGWSEDEAEEIAAEAEQVEARQMATAIAGRMQALRPIVGEARQLPPAPEGRTV